MRACLPNQRGKKRKEKTKELVVSLQFSGDCPDRDPFSNQQKEPQRRRPKKEDYSQFVELGDVEVYDNGCLFSYESAD